MGVFLNNGMKTDRKDALPMTTKIATEKVDFQKPDNVADW